MGRVVGVGAGSAFRGAGVKCRRPNCPGLARPGRDRGFCPKHYELAPKGLVDAKECRAHVAGLRAAGYSMRAIGKLANLNTDTLTNLGLWKCGQVRLGTHNKIMAIPFPDSIVNRGANDIRNVGVKRRIQALVAAGYSMQMLADEFGVSHQNVGFWLKRETVTSETFHKVDVLFRRLELVPGPSVRARLRGQRLGWPPPFAWDDIDDPNAGPQTPTRSKQSEWSDTYQELRGMGLVEERIAERLGVTRESLMQRLRRLEAA